MWQGSNLIGQNASEMEWWREWPKSVETVETVKTVALSHCRKCQDCHTAETAKPVELLHKGVETDKTVATVVPACGPSAFLISYSMV